MKNVILVDKNAQYTNFCEQCGKELEERLANLYVDLVYSNDDLDVLRTSEDSPPPENTIRISMKELIKVIKEYESEMFIEGV